MGKKVRQEEESSECRHLSCAPVPEPGCSVSGPLLRFQPRGHHEPSTAWRWLRDRELGEARRYRGDRRLYEGALDPLIKPIPKPFPLDDRPRRVQPARRGAIAGSASRLRVQPRSSAAAQSRFGSPNEKTLSLPSPGGRSISSPLRRGRRSKSSRKKAVTFSV